MNALEIIGAAGIWALLLACGLFLGLVAFAFLTVAFDRWRIHRAFWSFKSWKWLSEDELNEYLDDRARDWWQEVKEDRAWCRSNDFKAGMRAAAYHLLRDHVHIVKRRRLPNPQPSAGGEAAPLHAVVGQTLPCDSPCPKCGSTDIHRRYCEQGEDAQPTLIRGPGRSTKFVDRASNFGWTANCDCIVHACRVCSYSWDTDRLPNPKADPAAVVCGSASSALMDAGDRSEKP